MSKENIFLGTCGWSYKEWEGNFYQKQTGESKLRAYSRVFKTAEIDSTFYRNPSKGTVMGWLKYSPSDVIFSAKLPKTITHDKALDLRKDVKADLEEFLDLMRLRCASNRSSFDSMSLILFRMAYSANLIPK